MHPWWEVIWLFATAYALSAVCGMFRQLYVVKRRKVLEVSIAGGYAGCVGLGISLLWSKYFDDPAVLLGICVFSGLSGATGIDQLLLMMRKVKEAEGRKGGPGND
jgi:hypothetical protein